MTPTTCHMSISLDGFVAGPDQSRENPLGVGDEAVERDGHVACGRCHVNQDHRIDEKSSVGDALAKASAWRGSAADPGHLAPPGRQVGPAPGSSRAGYPHAWMSRKPRRRSDRYQALTI